jgi:hypothetical protein
MKVDPTTSMFAHMGESISDLHILSSRGKERTFRKYFKENEVDDGIVWELHGQTG